MPLSHGEALILAWVGPACQEPASGRAAQLPAAASRAFRWLRLETFGILLSDLVTAFGLSAAALVSGSKKAVREILTWSAFGAVCPPERLRQWEERNQCPENDRLCEEAVWFTQNMLLGTRRDMEQIAEAIRKIRAYAAELARA
ncbi:MAG: hypothetical protein NZ554_07475 [Bryobacteraceae bacterium]|nr:hypothetical protein [Bryobacteraceae bacterium]